ncbi:MAG: hypothetical protein U5J62_11785 [Desulfurivibrio sp.]|nr:hypothetical protein [Desulfurivibrio sp.]
MPAEKRIGVRAQFWQFFRWTRCALLLVLLCLPVVGCGKKTEPQSPAAARPQPIDDLAYQYTAGGVELSWSVPTRGQRGGDLAYVIPAFVLYRARLAPGAEPEEPLVFERLRRIDNRAGSRGRLRQQEQLTAPGRYFFQVESRAGWLLYSDPSNRVTVTWPPPGDEE